MTDLIERLRGPCPSIPAMRDAADELTRLTAEVAELREENERLRAEALLFEQMRDQRNGQLKRALTAERERDAALAEVERVKAFHLQARSAVKKWCADDQAADLGQMINDLLRITGAALTAGETDNGN